MSDITVDARVLQGSLNQVAGGRSIGTDDCAPGVGMVALMPDGSVWCAHFTCAVHGEDQATIERNTYAVLLGALDEQPLMLQACTSAPLEGSTGAIWAGIGAFYAAATIDRQAKGIYITQQGRLGCVKGEEQVLGHKAPSNGHATIPMAVQQ